MNRQLFRHHPTTGYLFVPHLKARIEHEGGGYLMRTNGQGFRCRHEFEAAKRPGTFRILLFGDSYTAGDGVSDKHRYGEVLEAGLTGVEVYNFGLPGSGTDQHYLTWREFARDLEADLVVISVLVENIRRVAARFRPFQTPEGEPLVLAKPYFSLDAEGSLTLHHVPVPSEPVPESAIAGEDAKGVDRGGRLQWLRSLVSRMGPDVKNRVQRLTGYQPVPGYDRADHPDWRLMKAILTQWIGELETPVVICPIPLYQFIEETASPHAYLARFAELHDPPRVRVHDPLPDFQRAPRAERRGYRFEVDCHLTPAAHEVLGNSLARAIEPLLKEEPA